METRAPAELAELRRAVFRLRSADRTRVFVPAVHAGDLLGERASFDDAEGVDVGLRHDVAAALLARVADTVAAPVTWLTRPGLPQPHDLDFAWLGACQWALEDAGLAPSFLVITKNGWYDPLTLESVVWNRLRIRTGPT